MNTVNNTNLVRWIKAYLATPGFDRPLVIAGHKGTGRHSIVNHTLRSLGLEKISFWDAMKFADNGGKRIAVAMSDDANRFNLDYHLSLDFVKRTGHPAIVITDIRNINLDDPEFKYNAVRYKLTQEDWLTWGEENIGAPGHDRERINKKVRAILSLYEGMFMAENGFPAVTWKKISDRWNHIESLQWLQNLSTDDCKKVYMAALQEFTLRRHRKLVANVSEFLDHVLWEQ